MQMTSTMAHMSSDVRTRLEQSKAQLEEVVRQRDRLNVRIIQLQSEIRALTATVLRDVVARRQNDLREAMVGISDAIRSIMRLHGKPMTAGQVKDALDLMGYDFKGMTNASSVVHNTLRRMAGTGEVDFVPATKMYEFPFRTHLGATRLK